MDPFETTPTLFCGQTTWNECSITFAVIKGFALHCVCMFLFYTRRGLFFAQRQETESCESEGGEASKNRTVRQKLAIASAETYKALRKDMDEIIKTSDWKHARGVGFTEVTHATSDNGHVLR